MYALRISSACLFAFYVCGIGGCSSLNQVFDSDFWGKAPTHQQPATVQEFLEQPRPGFDQ
jgi:hypothetical protein